MQVVCEEQSGLSEGGVSDRLLAAHGFFAILK
jgi:hypothetical protein